MAKISGLVTTPTNASELAAKNYADTVSVVSPINTGSILLYAGTSIPAGFLACDGSAVSRTTYSALHAILQAASYPYGSGDGSTTFHLPNAQHRFPVGKGGPNTGTLGLGTGSFDHTHIQGDHAHVLNHVHSISHEHTFTGHSHTMAHTHSLAAHTHNFVHSHTVGTHYHGHSLVTSTDTFPHSHNIATRDDTTNGTGYLRGSDATGTTYNNDISIDTDAHQHGLTVNSIGNSTVDSVVTTNSTARDSISYIPATLLLAFSGTSGASNTSSTGVGLNDTYPNHTSGNTGVNSNPPNQNTGAMNSIPAMSNNNPPYISLYYVIKT